MRHPFRGWRPALRIARRDALRARGRSLLIVVMIALPVLAVVSLDVLGRTADVTTVEGLDRQMGHADSLVSYYGDSSPVDQSPTMDSFGQGPPDDGQQVTLPTPTARTIADVLPPGSQVVELGEGDVVVRTKVGLARPGGFEIDLRQPIAQGLFKLTDGRLPTSRDEVVVSARLAARGFDPGATMTFSDGRKVHVVGLVESATSRDPSLVVGLPGTLQLGGAGSAEPQDKPLARTWLVDAPGGVSWAQVRALNTHGLFALSRAVLADPPPASEVTMPDGSSGPGAAEVAILAMIVAMALLEVVLLAGPAFAVGVRRQQRSLALLAATGGEPPDIRKVVLASGVVLGAVSGVVGAAGGIAAAWLAEPAVQGFSSERFGPFQVEPRDVLAIAACGMVSALLAALAPAVMASRQDVVAVLAGRRGQTRRPVWSPVLGSVLLALGITGAVIGASKSSGGEFFITGAAISSVLGMVLLIPLAVAQLGRFAGVLPLPLRFALRDASRQRSRTAPAVAAVAAVVAGVVALGIGASSDAAQSRATYTPNGPRGAALITSHAPPDSTGNPWAAMRAAITRQLPAANITDIRGVPDEMSTGRPMKRPAQGSGIGKVRASADPHGQIRQLTIEPVTSDPSPQTLGYSSGFGASILVGAGSLDAMGLDLTAADRTRAHAALAAGGVVLFGYAASDATAATLRTTSMPTDGSGDATEDGRWTVPATVVTVHGSVLPGQGVLSEAAAKKAGVPVETTALLADGTTIDQSAEDALTEALRVVSPSTSVWVERGFHDNSTSVALLLLGVVGGVLVLGGTLTATFLALSDARPDFATMSSVGAAPRTRRLVAASYAMAVGVVGAALGALVGFVPGIAVTYPLTSTTWAPPGSTDVTGAVLPDHFLDIPWLLVLGLVVVLPLFTAAVVGLASRSRLPMVSRLS
jgi:putative ABC transport system permease protein